MTIAEFDRMEADVKRSILHQCCGSKAWVEKMLDMPPAEDLIDLFEDAEEKWYECEENDWKEAFTHHPKIGDLNSIKNKFASDAFAAAEQAAVNESSENTLRALFEANKLYEEKFGYIFIVFATGKSSEEMLAILQSRLGNTHEKEIMIAMEEQNKITQERLKNLFL